MAQKLRFFCGRYLVIKPFIVHHFKQEFVSAIPDSTNKRIQTNHSASQGFTQAQLQSVSPDPGRSLFSIFWTALYFFSKFVLGSFFYLPPNIPENFVDFFYVLSKIDYLACNTFSKLQLSLTPLTWNKNCITCQMVELTKYTTKFH